MREGTGVGVVRMEENPPLQVTPPGPWGQNAMRHRCQLQTRAPMRKRGLTVRRQTEIDILKRTVCAINAIRVVFVARE